MTRALERRWPDTLQAELAHVYTPDRPGSRLLDYGCGSPEFLDEMSPRGWHTIGADFMPHVVEAVARHGHEALVVDDGFWSGIDDRSLAMVRLNHVLEHLYEPRVVLGHIRRSLGPGGLLHVVMPNPDSLWSGLFRSRWFDLDCPRHVVLYPAGLLRALLGDLGFAQVRVFHQVLSTVMVRSWGYVLQDLGRIEPAQVGALMEDEVRAEALKLPAKLAAVLGRSDRYHVFASV
jgi:SAM-dependent methyltransferase